ncbi:HIT domain-containing protein [Streptomyces sp. NPDC046985]|uniref:HIT family protein n=1 Tax=Streptomyces sp. NPDC046985 TaxID=3155377 RepID=UPI0033CD7F49
MSQELSNVMAPALSLFRRLGHWILRETRAEGESACIFCQRNQPRLNQIMQQNKTFYVRYDNFPATAGHVEVVPKRHVESFFDLTAREVKDAYSLILAARQRLTDEHRPDGFTIGVNEGRAAGRTVDHLHIHLIPRRVGDVEDPRGGIRRAVPNCDPDLWTRKPEDESALKQLTEAHSSRH